MTLSFRKRVKTEHIAVVFIHIRVEWVERPQDTQLNVLSLYLATTPSSQLTRLFSSRGLICGPPSVLNESKGALSKFNSYLIRYLKEHACCRWLNCYRLTMVLA